METLVFSFGNAHLAASEIQRGDFYVVNSIGAVDRSAQPEADAAHQR